MGGGSDLDEDTVDRRIVEDFPVLSSSIFPSKSSQQSRPVFVRVIIGDQLRPDDQRQVGAMGVAGHTPTTAHTEAQFLHGLHLRRDNAVPRGFDRLAPRHAVPARPALNHILKKLSNLDSNSGVISCTSLSR